MRPNITTIDVATGEATTREMTEQEYQDLLASGWTADGSSTKAPIDTPQQENN